MEKSKLKTIEDLKTLTKLVNEWDPIGLIRGGAPDDEYSCIVPAIFTQLQKGKNADELYSYYTTEIPGHFGFSFFSVKEPYKERLISHTKESIKNIYRWYKNESLTCSNKAFSRFMIEQEIKELKHKSLPSSTLALLSEIETGLSREEVIAEIEDLEMWKVISENKDKYSFHTLGYEFNHQLWVISRQEGIVEHIFEELKDVLHYLSPYLTTV